MGIETEVAAFVAVDRRQEAKAMRLAKRMLGLREIHEHYRKLFFDTSGSLKPEAVAVLRDLGRIARFGTVDPVATDAELRMNEGRRHLLLHIFDRFELDEAKIARLVAQLRENTNE